MAAPNVSRVQTGSMGEDASLVPIPAPTKFVCTDGTTPSPATISSTEIDLTVPTGAIWFVVRAVGGDLRVTMVNAATATIYYLVPDGQAESFPVANASTVHLLRNAAVDVTAYYRFEQIG